MRIIYRLDLRQCFRYPSAGRNHGPKGVRYEAGTPEGDVVATMGIAVSVFVSILIVSFFTVIGTGILPLLPKFVTDSFAYIVPAIFSAVLAELSSKDYVLGVLVFAVALLVVVVAPQLG